MGNYSVLMGKRKLFHSMFSDWLPMMKQTFFDNNSCQKQLPEVFYKKRSS